MAGIKKLDLCCFSYLASAKVLQINKCPDLNDGAEIDSVIETLAADAPMVAITASRLGLHTGLIANELGNDKEGEEISKCLIRNNIVNSVENNLKRKTPFIIVLSDENGNREWFSYTRIAGQDLMNVELSKLQDATLAYIDLYEGINSASIRAINYADKHSAPLFLNLSGRLITDKLVQELRQVSKIAIIQTSIRETRKEEAEQFLNYIHSTIQPDISIVTLGEKGAITRNQSRIVRAKAHSVDLVHSHGAGAAFSSGFAFGYLRNWELETTSQFVCGLGSLSCSRERGFEFFSPEDINDFIKRNEYLE